MPTHQFRFSLGEPETVHLSGEISIQSPTGVPYAEVYAVLAEVGFDFL
jgi:hypothetical protein